VPDDGLAECAGRWGKVQGGRYPHGRLVFFERIVEAHQHEHQRLREAPEARRALQRGSVVDTRLRAVALQERLKGHSVRALPARKRHVPQVHCLALKRCHRRVPSRRQRHHLPHKARRSALSAALGRAPRAARRHVHVGRPSACGELAQRLRELRLRRGPAARQRREPHSGVLARRGRRRGGGGRSGGVVADCVENGEQELSGVALRLRHAGVRDEGEPRAERGHERVRRGGANGLASPLRLEHRLCVRA
jgi:hypothetical protein